MALKLVAAREALLEGVREVVVADGAGERPVLAALAGGGTRIELEREGVAA
jgi:acetylglutamate/LysW-gamma-L-alpha-aminoadipate kinase